MLYGDFFNYYTIILYDKIIKFNIKCCRAIVFLSFFFQKKNTKAMVWSLH